MLLRVAADAKDETDEDGVNALVEEEREFATMATVAMAAVLNFIVRRRSKKIDGAQLFPPYPFLCGDGQTEETHGGKSGVEEQAGLIRRVVLPRP
jgi:hypothetical protein